jgi:hypothetical protein
MFHDILTVDSILCSVTSRNNLWALFGDKSSNGFTICLYMALGLALHLEAMSMLDSKTPWFVSIGPELIEIGCICSSHCLFRALFGDKGVNNSTGCRYMTLGFVLHLENMSAMDFRTMGLSQLHHDSLRYGGYKSAPSRSG